MSCVGVVAGVDRAQDVRAASALKIGVFDRHTRSPWTSRRTIRFFALLGTPHLDRRRTAGTLRTGLIGQRRARHAGGVTFVVTFWSAATVWLASTRTLTISLLRTFSHVCALDDVTPPDVTPPDGKDFALGAVALAVPALTVMPPPECASCSVDCQYMRCA